MERKEALESVKANVENANLVNHMLAVEAIMRAMAKRLGGDEEEWGLAGLLHDIDVELTEGDMKAHARMGADLVREMGASEDIARAIMSHNETLGVPRNSMMEKALYCADPLTGLITAVALVHPNKKLAEVAVSSVQKRFKAKNFAAGANREQIATCSECGLTLDEFIELGLNAMKAVAGTLGL